MDLIPATIVPSLFRSTFAAVLAIGLGLGTPTSAAPPAAEQDPDPSRPFVFAREIWNRTASAEDLRNPRTFDGVPDRSELVEVPIGAQGLGDGFVQRIRGWIEPPETGSYRFAITSDDDSVLLISPGGDASRARPVALVTGFTGPDDFDGRGQISGPITLIRGQPCYLEARHRDVAGADHLVVGWKVPRSGLERPIPIGTVLEPRFRLEVWEGVPSGDPRGFTVFGTPPTRSRPLFNLATPEGIGSQVATRLRGTWSAPRDGLYRFMLSADDAAVLEVTTTDPSPRLLGQAILLSWVDPDSWEGLPGQTTDPIRLRQGETVQIEVRHSQGNGPGHAAVGVVGGGLDQRPITSPVHRRPTAGPPPDLRQPSRGGG